MGPFKLSAFSLLTNNSTIFKAKSIVKPGPRLLFFYLKFLKFKKNKSSPRDQIIINNDG
jgi:hypothetical protein